MSYTLIALLATVAVSIASPDTDALLANEKAAWQAFKVKNAEDFKKVVSPNMVGVYAEGAADMAKEMADMQKWDMKSFEISDYKTTAVGADTMIATYKVKLAGTFDGKDASGDYNAGSVWKKHNGEWHAIFHTDVMAAGGPTTDAQKKE